MKVGVILCVVIAVSFELHGKRVFCGLRKNDAIDHVIKFVEFKRWKSVLFITDYAWCKDISAQFSRVNIYYSFLNARDKLLSKSLTTFLRRRSECNVIVWCLNRCLQTFIAETTIFYKNVRYLLVYENQQDFIRDMKILHISIRVDSDVHALTAQQNNSWLLHKIQLNNFTDHKINDKIIAQFQNSSLLWIKDQNTKFSPVLEGFTLKVCIMNFPPLTTIEKNESTTKVTGLRIIILRAIAYNLGFTQEYFDCTGANSAPWATQVNKLRKSDVDLSGTFMAISLDNLIGMSQSVHVFVVSMIFIFHNVKYDLQERGIFAVYSQPFARSVWICIILFCMLGVILSYFATNGRLLPCYRLPLVYSWYDWSNRYLQEYLFTFPSQGLNNVSNKSEAKKVFITSTFLLIFLCTIYYGSDFTSSLASDKYVIPFNTLKDLVEDGRFIFGSRLNSPMEALIKNTQSEEFVKIEKKSMYRSLASTEAGLEDALRLPLVVMCVSEFCNNLNCSYVILKKKYFQLDVGIHFPKNSQYVEFFSRSILLLRSSGILSKIVKSAIETDRSQCDVINDDFEKVTIQRCAAPFVVLAAGLVLAIIALIFEKLIE